jgi:ubiquinone/menaquinone biosynthesis C-methylase UbiE
VHSDYEKVAGTYDEYYSHNLSVAADRFAEAISWNRLGGPGLNIVELAAGTGVITRRLAAALGPGSSLTAVDISEAMLAENERKIDANRRAVNYVVGDAIDFLRTQPDDSIDGLLCAWGVCYLPHAKLRKELSRTLRSGAYIGIIENREDTLKELDDLFIETLLQDPTMLRSAIRISLPADHSYIEKRIIPRGCTILEGFDAESLHAFGSPDEIVNYMMKSGVSAGYIDAIEPGKLDMLIEMIGERIADIGAARIPVVHRYSVVTAHT